MGVVGLHANEFCLLDFSVTYTTSDCYFCHGNVVLLPRPLKPMGYFDYTKKNTHGISQTI